MPTRSRVLVPPTRLLTLTLVTLALPLMAVGMASAALQLSEILADPVSDWNGDGEVHFRDDEWIEVTNTGPEGVDLSAYYLKDALGDDSHLNLSGVLFPGESAVFYGSDAVAWQQANGLTITGLSLNNSGDTVELLYDDPDASELVLVDIYFYVDHEADDDRASGRLPDSGEWMLFDGLNLYNGDTPPWSTGCEPTPGVPNDCVPNVPNQPATWGQIKVDYR